MTNQQGAPEALRLAAELEREKWHVPAVVMQAAAEELRRQHARIAELEAQLEAVGAGGVSGPLIGQPQAMPDLSQLTEREQERIAFKGAHRHLDLDEVPDAWGRPMFKHSHVEASWLGWTARASQGQASSQAGEYPALVCDYCGALTPDPWHSSGMLHGKMSKHIHSCDACAARGAAEAQAAKQQGQLI